MKSGVASLAVTLMLATGAQAAPPKPMSVDRSGSSLIDAATTEKIWKENTSARVLKLYPTKKFRYVSEMGGGFTEGKTCVVSARAMVLPVVYLPVQGSKIIYEPVKAATAFDAVPGLTGAQCSELASAKLRAARRPAARRSPPHSSSPPTPTSSRPTWPAPSSTCRKTAVSRSPKSCPTAASPMRSRR